MKVHILIPVHNRLIETKKCIASLLNQTYSNIEIYIIDDGSSDGTKEWVDKINATRIEGNGNLWWTGAIAKGVNYVLPLSKENDFIMTLNNDVVLDKNAINSLVLSSKKENNAIFGSLAIDNKTNFCMSSGAITKSWILNINFHPYREKMSSEVDNSLTEVSMLTGRSVLYPISVIKSVGNFDSKWLPHYGGDIEMTVRIKNAGYLLFIDPKSKVYVNREETGLNPGERYLSFSERLSSLFSIKSANSLYYRTILAIKIVPFYSIPSYIFITYLKIFFSLFFKK